MSKQAPGKLPEAPESPVTAEVVETGKMGLKQKKAAITAACEAMVAAQMRNSEIVRTVSAKFNISERQGHRYVAQVYDALAAEDEAEVKRPLRKHQLRQSLQAVFKKAFKNDQLQAAVAALDRLAKIDGLYAPVQVGLNVSGQVDVKAMTSDDKRRRLDELMRTANDRARLASAPKNGVN